MNQGNAAGVSGTVVTLLHKDVERAESGYRMLRKGSYPLQLSLVDVSYVAVVGEDTEIDTELEFICYHGKYDSTVHIVGLRGPQVAISDFLLNRKHYELNRDGQTANAALVDNYQEVVDQIDEQMRRQDGMDARDERHAIATVSL